MQLFERRTRQVILTCAGETYLARVRQGFRCLAEATAELKPEGVTSLLHIAVHAFLRSIGRERAWHNSVRLSHRSPFASANRRGCTNCSKARLTS